MPCPGVVVGSRIAGTMTPAWPGERIEMPLITNMCCGGEADLPAHRSRETPHLPGCPLRNGAVWMCDCDEPEIRHDGDCQGEYVYPDGTAAPPYGAVLSGRLKATDRLCRTCRRVVGTCNHRPVPLAEVGR